MGECARKFESLLKYSEFYSLHPREEWMCEKYQDGLKYDIQRAVLPLHIMHFGELIERCLEFKELTIGRINMDQEDQPETTITRAILTEAMEEGPNNGVGHIKGLHHIITRILEG